MCRWSRRRKQHVVRTARTLRQKSALLCLHIAKSAASPSRNPGPFRHCSPDNRCSRQETYLLSMTQRRTQVRAIRSHQHRQSMLGSSAARPATGIRPVGNASCGLQFPAYRFRARLGSVSKAAVLALALQHRNRFSARFAPGFALLRSVQNQLFPVPTSLILAIDRLDTFATSA